MRLRTLVALGTLGATLALSACSAGPGAGGAAPSVAPTAAAPTDASPASAPPSAASTTPGPVETLPAAQCLSGTYALVRFVAVGGETYGTGQGGDVTLAFDDGRYTLAGAGAEPVVVTIGGQTGNLTVDGTAKGTYRLSGGTATFAEPAVTGRGTLSGAAGTRAQQLTMKQVTNVIGLAGDGQVACTAQAMTITLAAIRLELGRV